MSKAEGAVAWAVNIANSPAHGYDQANRWGPDYDCASLVISAWESVGVSVREAGASYTGNMKGAFLACGFREVTASVNLATGVGLRPGDVVLCAAHTAMVVKSGTLVAARINELGQTVGGQTGDQNGKEITLQSYYNYPWTCVLRYDGAESTEPEKPAEPAKPTEPSAKGIVLPLVRQGMKGDAVRAVQGILMARGFSVGPDGADGDFGYNTRQGVLNFQRYKKLTLDGIVGEKTWKALLGVSE